MYTLRKRRRRNASMANPVLSVVPRLLGCSMCTMSARTRYVEMGGFCGGGGGGSGGGNVGICGNDFDKWAEAL